MIELGDDDMGECSEAGLAPGNRLYGRRGLHDLLGGLAAIFRTDGADDATSSISSLSCPSGRRAPPQEGQVQVPASGSIRRSARGRCAGKARIGAGRSL